MRNLSLEHLECRIDATPILSNVTLNVQPGAMVAIVGPNGAGKTTLLRSIAGFLPAGGTVRIDGTPLETLNAKQRGRMLAYVGQEETVPEGLSVRQAVALGRLPHQSMWRPPSAADREVVESAMQRVGVTELADRNCSQLSGGQRKRVFLARAVAQDTGLILLDEPTNHLDVEHQLSVLELMRASDATIVSTIHDLDLALTHFDICMVLHRGEVLACGSPADVLNTQRVRTVFGVESVIIQQGLRSPHLIIDGLHTRSHPSNP
ncbi:putative siderophore transport system ATP-binding protein YusV [Corynebacterium ciconiae DSM 44920]|uniref:ABC transporter ATP-binding protein n=1 Tax=Corynebacterium ciconiae TaxID=227319 RepID=UPI0003755964|nr:ABC transporter ATP-binding protein [Corynebacterium ciconiae]WKD61063.1 putative siderophore transport system ATP-binding protein YusV [Corynebacterium ciconiae DSM 44920]